MIGPFVVILTMLAVCAFVYLHVRNRKDRIRHRVEMQKINDEIEGLRESVNRFNKEIPLLARRLKAAMEKRK